MASFPLIPEGVLVPTLPLLSVLAVISVHWLVLATVPLNNVCLHLPCGCCLALLQIHGSIGLFTYKHSCRCQLYVRFPF